jgi:hypothetical protein
MLLDLVENTKQKHVLLVLANCVSIITNFDIWRFKGAHDIFALVMKFLGVN